MFCPHIIKSVFSYLTVLICKRFYTVFLDYKSNCFKSELGLNSMKKHDELDFSIVNFPFFDFSIVNFPFFLTCGIRIVFFVVLILFTVNAHCLICSKCTVKPTLVTTSILTINLYHVTLILISLHSAFYIN